MCTVVTRLKPGSPPQILALRDELTTRAFDDPDRWWPDEPDVVGGRDRLAGGTWCASRFTTGVTALVLNRPQRRVAAPGAPSRGVLPLLAVRHGREWVERIELEGMASYSLVLVAPTGVSSWVFDGATLTGQEHEAGTHMFTSGGAEDGKADRFLALFEAARYPGGWRELLESTAPADDPASLVVRREHDGGVFATVFGQLIDSEPGRLHVEYHRRPWSGERWETLDIG
jgi:hypothetical protein